MTKGVTSSADENTPPRHTTRRLEGVVCPIITPLDDCECVDHGSLQNLLKRVTPDVDGIMALGSTGELALLDPAVADDVVNTVADSLPDGPTLIVGVGDTGTTKALRNLRRLPSRTDYAAVCSPYYYPVDDADAVARHYLRIAEVAPVPILLYNIPQNTHLALPLDVVEELAQHENIYGIKDSSGDILYFRELLKLRGPSFSVLQGADEHLASVCLQMGADGYVAGIENVIPGTVRSLHRAITAGDQELAGQLQARIDQAVDLTRDGFWLAGLKAAISMIDGGTGRPAEPIPAATEAQRSTIVGALAKLGVGLQVGVTA